MCADVDARSDTHILHLATRRLSVLLIVPDRHIAIVSRNRTLQKYTRTRAFIMAPEHRPRSSGDLASRSVHAYTCQGNARKCAFTLKLLLGAPAVCCADNARQLPLFVRGSEVRWQSYRTAQVVPHTSSSAHV